MSSLFTRAKPIGKVRRLATAAVVLVFGWRACVAAERYITRPAIITKLTGVNQFAQDVSPNHQNTKLVYCQFTEKGIGIYFTDLIGKKPQLLCEQKEKGHSWKRFTMLGWSPDDSVFACAFPENVSGEEQILIFDGNDGHRLGKLAADENLYQLAWLSSSSFAYASRSWIRIVNRKTDGSWAHWRYLADIGTNMENLVATSATTLAWQDGQNVWSVDVNSGTPEKIWEATGDRLVELTYTTGADALLLNCGGDSGQSLTTLRLDNRQTASLGRIGPEQDYIHGADWDGQGSSYAYLTNDLSGSVFCVKTADMNRPAQFTWQGGVRSYRLNGNHLFFTGNPDNKTPGLWNLDPHTGSFKLIIGSESNSFAVNIESRSTGHVLTNSLGEQRFYHLWAPPNVSRGRKYPLLIAQEINTWFPYFQVASHCGYYVAIVDRPFEHTWYGVHERTWAEDVLAMRETAVRSLNIDTNQVYLYACSAETYYLSRTLEERGDLFRGALLFEPSALPEAVGLRDKRIFVIDGTVDGDATTRLPHFEDKAASQGGFITLCLQNGAGHSPDSTEAERDRAMEFASFLSEAH